MDREIYLELKRLACNRGAWKVMFCQCFSKKWHKRKIEIKMLDIVVYFLSSRTNQPITVWFMPSLKHCWNGGFHWQWFLWHRHDHWHRLSLTQNHWGSWCHSHNCSKVKSHFYFVLFRRDDSSMISGNTFIFRDLFIWHFIRTYIFASYVFIWVYFIKTQKGRLVIKVN